MKKGRLSEICSSPQRRAEHREELLEALASAYRAKRETQREKPVAGGGWGNGEGKESVCRSGEDGGFKDPGWGTMEYKGNS